jgi:hypothetical protein
MLSVVMEQGGATVSVMYHWWYQEIASDWLLNGLGTDNAWYGVRSQ